MILIGAPVWAFMWVRKQREALSPGGEQERQTVARRVYLFLVLFANIIALLSGGSWLIYQLLRNVGETFGRDVISGISWAFSVCTVAGVLLAYHAFTMLGDQRAKVLLPAPAVPAASLAPVTPTLQAEPEEFEPMQTAILLLRGKASEDIGPVVAFLRKEVPDEIEVEVLSASGATAAELSKWLATRASVDGSSVGQPAMVEVSGPQTK
jgi:hypothetical protein